ncbi:hypothetical protein BDA99DRAFT_559941 [Phascolomyces articulosus]|uniref:Uncharacterized protein n=1 Tax=Phascolomyces articulosus TaxID=60185 RepID=A0AAD5K0I1_9FUNG|nr:hypothetical protein BDA99DRAFT_559941 [Phascolomyces articulosus]
MSVEKKNGGNKHNPSTLLLSLVMPIHQEQQSSLASPSSQQLAFDTVSRLEEEPTATETTTSKSIEKEKIESCDHHLRQQKKYIDPVKCCLSHNIAQEIFSYVNTQKCCLMAMGVSKLWMNQVPILCNLEKVWRIVELVGSKHAVERILIHRCLGPHVQLMTLSQFQEQQNLYDMMDILRSQNCTKMNGLRFNSCAVDNDEQFINRLDHLSENLLMLDFDQKQLIHGSQLFIRPIAAVCPSLQHLSCSFIETPENGIFHPHDGQQLTISDYALPNEIDFMEFNLTSLWIGCPKPRTSNENWTVSSSSTTINKQSTLSPRTNCSGQEITSIIEQSPHLQKIILCCTGDNIAPCVIKAIIQLASLRFLSLLYDLTPNHHDGALYSLLAKHVDLGTQSTLTFLALNVADYTIMDLVGKTMTLRTLVLINGFNLASYQGLLQLAHRLGDSVSLKSLLLYKFDLRPWALLDLMAHAPNLTMIDFTDCDVERDSYANFLNKASMLKTVAQPLVLIHHGPQHQIMVDLADPFGNRNPFSLVHIDELPPYPPPGFSILSNRRNPYLVLVSDTLFNVENRLSRDSNYRTSITHASERMLFF